MTIWVGFDGTLNDDEGDGPAFFTGDDAGLGSGLGDLGSVHGSGTADAGGGSTFGSTLADLGSSFANALGSGSGSGSGLGSGSGSSGMGTDLSNLFSGTGDTGSALGDVFGKLAKTALPAVEQAAEGALTRATSSHPQSYQQTAPQTQQHLASQSSQATASQSPQATASQSPQATPVQKHPALKQQTHPALPDGGVAHVRHKHDVDPKARLNLMLAHLAKKYGMPAPGGAGHFVNKMMGGPAAHT